MYVTDLNLKEFRGVKGCKEPIKFTKFNILLGRNNSGKSTVLQALSLLPHPQLGQPMALGLGGGDIRSLLVTYLLGGRDSLVFRYAGEASLEFGLSDKRYRITFDTAGNPRAFAGDEDVSNNVHEACEYLAPAWKQAVSGITVQEPRHWTVLVPNEAEFIKKVTTRLSEKWAQVEKADIHLRVVREVINPTIDESFTEVIRRDSSLWVRKEAQGKSFYVNVQDLGDGIKKALSIILFIELCSPEIVLWDDFEVSAHPSLVKSILSWLAKKDWQVVLATHSIDVLYELAEIKPGDAQVIQLRKVDDVLIHKRLSMDDVGNVLRGGSDPRLLVNAVE